MKTQSVFKEPLFKKILKYLNKPIEYLKKVFGTKIAIDLMSISNIVDGDKGMSYFNIIKLYHKSNVFIYKSHSEDGKLEYHKPTVLQRGLFSRKATFIDWNDLTEEQKNKLIEKIK